MECYRSDTYVSTLNPVSILKAILDSFLLLEFNDSVKIMNGNAFLLLHAFDLEIDISYLRQ